MHVGWDRNINNYGKMKFFTFFLVFSLLQLFFGLCVCVLGLLDDHFFRLLRFSSSKSGERTPEPGERGDFREFNLGYK